MKWWQQQMAFNEWSYDTAQPPLVYDAKVGGKKRRIVSVATMEGVWFAYDAQTGQPIYQRVKVIDRTRASAARAGQAGRRLSVVARRHQLLAGVLRLEHELHLQRRVRDRRDRAAGQALADARRSASGCSATSSSVSRTATSARCCPGWHDHGSISAIDVNTGKQVWKFQTPEPERGGVSTTDSGLGFAGGGDGVLRAFDLKSGKVLWTFQTGHQIAAGPSIYSVDGKEYIAITSGGTPTSSNGGIASELQIFALGGSSSESKPPTTLSISTGGARSIARLRGRREPPPRHERRSR